ncbi:hypothetical protein ACAW74_12930 [Fibrella sp. WM1]|uniref:hypothetical protein n=1 Tax=Fibrella musci TaxID=3242485 RepID=UPI0035220C03
MKHLVALLLSIGPLWGIAQATPTLLTVLYADGPIQYRASAREPWQVLAGPISRLKLQSTYEAKLSKDAILVLASDGATPITLRHQAGIARLADWIRQPATDEVARAMNTYFATFWQALTNAAVEVEAYASDLVGRKGRRSRGDGCTTPLMLSPDYDAAIAGDSAIRFSWKRASQTALYTLAFYDNYDEKANLLYQIDVADTTLLVVPNKPFLERGVVYYWSVFPKGTPNCARYTFTLAKTEAFRQVETEAAQLMAQLGSDAALSAFLSAALYERNHFFPEAHRAYLQAHRLSPKNTLYRDGLALFLARRGLPEQASQLYTQR